MAVTYYIRIDGVAGDSTNPDRLGWFDLGSFSLGETNTGSVTTPGEASFGDLQLLLTDNTALAGLLARGAGGQQIAAIEIEGVETGASGSQTIFDLTLNDVTVGSVGAGASTEPSTSAALSYRKIGLVTNSGDGAVQSFGWDLALNAAIDPATLVAPASSPVAPVPDPVVYYLRIDGVAGDSTAKGYEGWFEIPSFVFGQTFEDSGGGGGGGGGGAGKVSFSDLSLTLLSETVLAGLFQRAAEGKSIPAVEIEGVAGSQVVYDLTLNDVRVSSLVQIAGDPNVVSASFSYGKIGLVTTSIGGGVPVAEQEFGWDLANNVAIDPSTLVAPSSSAIDALPEPVDYYLKIDGVAGDVTAKGFEGWFEIPSFFIGEFNGGSKAFFQDLSVALADNTALANLLDIGAAGEFVSALEIRGVSGGSTPETVYTLRLNDVFVSSVQNSTTADGAANSISFGYNKIGIITTGGGVTQSFAWDIAANKSIDASKLVAPSSAAIDSVPDPDVYYLRIDGIAGTSTAKGYEGWFELPTFSFGESNAGFFGGGVNFQDLFVTLDDAAALSALFARGADGKFIQAIEVEGVSGKSQQVVFDLTLNDVLVRSVESSASFGEALADISFAFGKIGLVTTSLDSFGVATGQQSFGWDLANNIAIDPSKLATPTSAVADEVQSPVSYFLLIDGVAGDSTSASHKGWFEIGSFSLGESNSGDVAGGPGQVSFQDLSLGLDSETALAALLSATASGKFISALKIEGVSGGSKVVYELTINDLLVSSVGQSAVAGDTSASVAFNFAKIGLATISADLGERREFGWDLAAGKAIDPDTLAEPTAAFTEAVSEPVAYYLKIDGIAGDSTDPGYRGWFELPSFSFGEVFTGLAGGGGGGGGKVFFQDLALSLANDTLLAELLANSASGEFIAALKIEGVSDKGAEVYELTLNDVLVSSVSLGDAAGPDGPEVEASFAFGKIGFVTTGAGVLQQGFGWDVVANAAIDPDTLVSPVDDVAPLVGVASQVLANDTGASSTDLITTDGRVTLTGTASDDEQLYSVRIFDGAVDLGAATLDGENWTFEVTLGLGSHMLRAVAVDAAGNTTSTTAQPEITVLTRDAIVGQPGQETVNGTRDADFIVFGTANRIVNARAGDDVIALAGGSTYAEHDLRGGAGSDTLDLSVLASSASVNLATRIATGAEIGEAVLGSIENVIGGSAADTITASNTVNVMTGGGGGDAFVYASLNAARNGASFSPSVYDTIIDFEAFSEVGALHDTINLQAIDAIFGGANNAFSFNESPWDGQGSQFTGAGQLRYQHATDVNGRQLTIVAGNIHAAGQGNGLAPDFQIVLVGHHLLSASDFFL